jgi:hypothetical protein
VEDFIFVRVSKFGLWLSVKVSFICKFCFVGSYIWNPSVIHSAFYPSFQGVVFALSDQLCHSCGHCLIHVGQIFIFARLFLFL